MRNYKKFFFLFFLIINLISNIHSQESSTQDSSFKTNSIKAVYYEKLAKEDSFDTKLKVVNDILAEIEIYSEKDKSIIDVLAYLSGLGTLYKDLKSKTSGRKSMPVIRQKAIKALGLIGGNDSRQAVLSSLKLEWDEPAVLGEFFRSLANIGDTEEHVVTKSIIAKFDRLSKKSKEILKYSEAIIEIINALEKLAREKSIVDIEATGITRTLNRISNEKSTNIIFPTSIRRHAKNTIIKIFQ